MTYAMWFSLFLERNIGSSFHHMRVLSLYLDLKDINNNYKEFRTQMI